MRVSALLGLTPQDATGSLIPGTAILALQQQRRHEVKRTASTVWSCEIRESTSIFQTTLYIEDIPRFIPSLLIQEDELEYKTVILIDDSISMSDGDPWNLVQEALAGIINPTIQYGSKGLDLHFMHQYQFAKNMRSRTFSTSSVPLARTRRREARLEQLIEMYLPLFEYLSSTHELIPVIVITRSPAFDWARNLLKPRRRSGEGTELHECQPAVVEVPHPKGKRRNASVREKWRPIPLPSRNSTAGNSRPPKPSVTQQSSGATQTQPSSQPQATVSSSSTTSAVAATSAVTTSMISHLNIMIRQAGCWSRF
ncbi:hypothetical protein EDB19DRAFT_1961796 [Suillus lakei]|nr:hypothetical protein EDB19DRAFT_1961796 [Suillus lakei]